MQHIPVNLYFFVLFWKINHKKILNSECFYCENEKWFYNANSRFIFLLQLKRVFKKESGRKTEHADLQGIHQAFTDESQKPPYSLIESLLSLLSNRWPQVGADRLAPSQQRPGNGGSEPGGSKERQRQRGWTRRAGCRWWRRGGHWWHQVCLPTSGGSDGHFTCWVEFINRWKQKGIDVLLLS